MELQNRISFMLCYMTAPPHRPPSTIHCPPSTGERFSQAGSSSFSLFCNEQWHHHFQFGVSWYLPSGLILYSTLLTIITLVWVGAWQNYIGRVGIEESGWMASSTWLIYLPIYKLYKPRYRGFIFIPWCPPTKKLSNYSQVMEAVTHHRVAYSI